MDGSLFSIQVKCFHLIGFYRNDLIRHQRLFHAIQILSVICIAFCLLSEIYFVVENFQDVIASAESFGTLSTEVITLTKLITFYFCKEKFYQLMDQIAALSEQSTRVNSEALKAVNEFDKRVSLTYLCSGICTGLGYCITPIVISLVSIFTMNHEVKASLPMKAAFPYDVSATPAYELTYAVLCCGTFITIFISVRFSRFLKSFIHLSTDFSSGWFRFVVLWLMS